MSLYAEILETPVDHRRVTVATVAPGGGRTTTVLGLGTALAMSRRDQTIAVDLTGGESAHPRLGQRVTQSPSSVDRLLDSILQIHTSSDLLAHTSLEPSRLEAIAGAPAALSAEAVDMLLQVTATFRQLTVLDIDPLDIDAPSLQAAALATDDLVIPVRLDQPDALQQVAATVHWWNTKVGKGWLLTRGAVVAALRPRSDDPRYLAHEQHFLQHVTSMVRVVVPIPTDPALQSAGPFIWPRLQPQTQAAYSHLAVEVARRFARDRSTPSPRTHDWTE